MDPDDRFVVDDEPDQFELAQLEERFNADVVAAVGAGEPREFAVLLRDDAGVVRAGAHCTAWGGGCELHVVWVHPEWRGRGIGHALLAEVEGAARARGCRLLTGLTYEVLTTDLYERLGWTRVAEIDDYPAGTATRWYRKDL